MDTKGTPTFEAILSPVERKAVLANIRSTFGEKSSVSHRRLVFSSPVIPELSFRGKRLSWEGWARRPITRHHSARLRVFSAIAGGCAAASAIAAHAVPAVEMN